MKIQITCDNCQNIAEFHLVNEDTEVDIHSMYEKFLIGVSWENVFIENVREDLLNEISKVASHKERKAILKDRIADNPFAETISFDSSFTCRGCWGQLL